MLWVLLFDLTERRVSFMKGFLKFPVIQIGIVLFIVILTGCAKEEVKALPPLDKNKAAEECAVLVIPTGAKINRIDGAKRGLFRSWSGGQKAATLSVPAGEHTIIYEYSHPTDGWATKKKTYTTVMSAGKMYMLSVARKEKVEPSTVSIIINRATSFARDQIIDNIPFVGWLPRPEPEGVSSQINEIDHAVFDQYLIEGYDNIKITAGIRWLIALVCVLWLFILFVGLRVLWYFIFMGKFMCRHPVFAFIISACLVVTGVLVINYNTSGILSLYLLSTLLIGIGISGWDFGKECNKSGVEKYKKNDYNGAISDYDEAIKLAPYNATYISNRGLAYYNLQDWGKAITDFTRCCELKPNNDMAKKNLADARAGSPNISGLEKLNKNDYTGAVSDFTNAINLAPHNATYIFNRGLAYYSLQDWGKAISDFDCSINLASKNAAFINYRGLAYYNMRDWENAIADFAEAARLDPNNDTYKQNIANTQAQITNDQRIKRVGSNITQDNAQQFVNDIVQKLKNEGYHFVDERGGNADKLYHEFNKFPVQILDGEVYTYKEGDWLLLISRAELGIMWSFCKS